jgi:tetratricopeptide (TPR) repeat protein
MHLFFKYVLTYPVVFTIAFWGNSIFMHYRIMGNILFTIMPVVGAMTMYLWIIFLADEFLHFLQDIRPLVFIIKKLKIFSFIMAGLYAMIASVLWLNGISLEPVMTKTTKILSISNVNTGAFNYRRLTLAPWENNMEHGNILLTDKDEAGLYAGEDIEISIRKGILSLHRVLEIRPNLEKYYFKMLQAAPDSKVAIGGLINLYSKKNEFDLALEWYDKLLMKYPGECGIGSDLGGRLVDAKRYRQAVIVLRNVLEVKRDYDVLYMLGYALAWAGEKDEAEKYLIEAADLDPSDFRAFYTLGYVYRDTGKYLKAKEAWAKVLELLPNFPEVENNIKCMERNIQENGGKGQWVGEGLKTEL